MGCHESAEIVNKRSRSCVSVKHPNLVGRTLILQKIQSHRLGRNAGFIWQDVKIVRVCCRMTPAFRRSARLRPTLLTGSD